MYDILWTINIKSFDKVKEYIDFIESCKGLELPNYVESHHILPKSLFPEYEYDKDNLIELSAMNHYKAHVLLAEAYGGGMLYALRMMDSRYNDNDIPEINYSILREEFSKHHSNIMKEVWSDKEFSIKMSKSHLAAWNNNAARKENISNIMLDLWSDPVYKEKTSKALREATQTEEFKEKISITSKERWEDPEYRKMVNTNRDLVMQSDEYKSKMSDIQKERMKDPKLRAACGWNKGKGRPSRVCPHCKRSGNTLGFFKIHFNNCKIIRDFRLSFIRLHVLQLETLKDPKLLDKELSSRYLWAFIVGFKHLLRTNYDNE